MSSPSKRTLPSVGCRKPPSLAAAGGTEQGDELVFVNIQADALEDDLPVLKALDDILELDQFFLFRHGSNILSLYR